MALTPRTRFGPYEVVETIGAGGMGEVYRAHDTSLKRDVALKVLPAALANDADRLARLQREAEVLASLNHSNIAQIHGLEKSAGTTALVMELVEGLTLAELIARGPLPPNEALDIALQIANGLEAAHGRGIVHRDLKPTNIKLKPDGTVKVLDFGIAKALDTRTATGPGAQALTTPAMTAAGIVLGTAQYMSPEQARGKPVDQRADIWAYGCVLYEMLTGQPAFGGEDVTIVLARVLERGADLSVLPANVSPATRRTIELCLQKDLKKRLADIRDVKLALEGAFAAGSPEGTGNATATPSLWRRALPVAVAVAVTATVAVLVGSNLRPAEQPRAVNRFDWEFPAAQQFPDTQLAWLALSADGRRFVYAMREGLYVRDMRELEPRLIPGTGEGPTGPVFSPDGRFVAYRDGRQLKRVALAGGAAVTIVDDVLANAASWGHDDHILFTAPGGIFRVAASGGEPKLAIAAKAGESLYGPQLLPDGDSVLFSSTTDGRNWDSAQVVVQSLATGKQTVLVKGGNDARYVATGDLLYARGNQLLAVRFDADTLTVAGEEEPVAQGVMRARFLTTPAAAYGAAADGTLVYVRGEGNAGPQNTLVWVDAEGREEPLGLEPCSCFSPRVSPDGARVALQMVTPNLSDSDLWVWSLAQRTLTRLTFEPGLQDGPVWTPDSLQIAYRSVPGGIVMRRADGTGAPQPLLETALGAAPFGWSADGTLIFGGTEVDKRTIESLTVTGDRVRRMLLATSFNSGRPALAPDGRWLAYESDETGRNEIYVRPFPDVDAGKWQVSSGGGEEPVWASDGRTLFFRSSASMMASPVESAAAFAFRAPAAVLDIGAYTFTLGPPRTYDISPDGQRFLLTKRLTEPAANSTATRPRVVIVQNWREERGARLGE